MTPTAHAHAHAHAVARRLLGCDHLAADALQEALVALWREPSPPPDVRGWLTRAVVFRARHLRRTLARRHRHEHGAAVHCALHAGCDNPLHHAYAHELGDRLDQALAALPREQRAAFQLYVDTGLDYRGIAQRLALPVGTVRSRLHRARAALQRALAEHDEPAAGRAPQTIATNGTRAIAGERSATRTAAAPASNADCASNTGPASNPRLAPRAGSHGTRAAADGGR